MEFIKSTQNTLIKRIASLKDGKGRRSEQLFIAEGMRIVKDGSLPKYLFVTSENVDFATQYVDKCGVYEVSSEVFAKISDTKSPQGVLGVYAIPEVGVQSMTGDRAIVLDGVSDPGNVGTIIRTAVSCGFYDIYLINCADPYSPKVVRSTMSGIFKCRISIGSSEEVFTTLKDKGAKIYALDMGGKDLFSECITTPFALVVGSEARGVCEYTRQNSDATLSLPMEGDIESLNAGVSASVAMYVTRYKK